ncbi:hypothetical protein GCM10010299_73940 [Streptomyces tanashiensis]|nr:hypothetical protein [Streptomyces tanashiensis]GGY56640.1 hypothetical protein GCM10010299_73940 [Streptomyces tanashiensis]
MQDPVEHRLGGAGAERRPSGGGVRDGQRPGEHVGRRPGLSAHLLRCHVPHGPDRGAGTGQCRRVGGLRDAEVDDLRALLREQDVDGLQIAMDDAGPVDRRKRLGEPDGETVRHAVAQRPVLTDVLRERRALYVLHDDVRAARFDVDGQHACRAGALHAQQRRRLTPEPLPELGVRGEVLP